MAALFALLLAQLLPQAPACQWRDVPVWCEQGCDCVEVVSRLELAREELMNFWVGCPKDFDAGLHGWRIFITRKHHIPGPKQEVIFGVVVGHERRMVLSRDMRAALHELVHVQELALGTAYLRGDLYEHPLWARDAAVQELDTRYQLRFRSRTP